jgi:hypothetical protein
MHLVLDNISPEWGRNFLADAQDGVTFSDGLEANSARLPA